MAANFWLSSHCNQWLLDREEIQLERQRDYQYLKEEDYKKIHIFFINFIQALGEHLKLRQQVIATATLYYKRFYARNSLKSIDSLLMAPTCTYLAHKTEECGVISNNRFTAACNTVVKNKFSFAFPGEQFPYRMSQVSHHLNWLYHIIEWGWERSWLSAAEGWGLWWKTQTPLHRFYLKTESNISLILCNLNFIRNSKKIPSWNCWIEFCRKVIDCWNYLCEMMTKIL